MKSIPSVFYGDLQHLFLDSFDTTENAVTECHNLLQVHSFALVSKPTPKRKNKNKNTVYVKLPSDIQAACHGCKGAFNLWKQQNFSDNGEVHDVCRTKRREYRKHLRRFLNQIETDKAAKLCNAAQSNEKLFWKLIKSQKSSSQMSAFLIDGKMITDKNDIREMWAEHFEKLGTPSTNTNFDSVFLDRVSASVQEFMTSCKMIHLEILMIHLGKVCTISFERPVNYLCDAWHVFPPKYEAWTHFNSP